MPNALFFARGDPIAARSEMSTEDRAVRLLELVRGVRGNIPCAFTSLQSVSYSRPSAGLQVPTTAMTQHAAQNDVEAWRPTVSGWRERCSGREGWSKREGRSGQPLSQVRCCCDDWLARAFARNDEKPRATCPSSHSNATCRNRCPGMLDQHCPSSCPLPLNRRIHSLNHPWPPRHGPSSLR
jgi:hypothetical protein